MSFSGALGLLRQMTPEQRKILQERQVAAVMPAAGWIATLQPLSAYAAQALPARRGWGKVGGWGIVIAILCVFAHKVPGALVVAAAGLLMALVGFAEKKRLVGSEGELLERIDTFVLPLVRVLQQDMAPAAPLRLRVEAPLGKGTPVGAPRQLPGPFQNPRVKRVEESHYSRAWLDGDARLADGSLLRWAVVDRLRERRVVKTGASGKTKTKLLERRRRAISARLGVRADRYAPIEAGGGGAGAVGGGPGPRRTGSRLVVKVGTVQVVRGERRHVLKMRRVVEPAKEPQAGDAAPLLEAIGSLYGHVVRRRGGVGGRRTRRTVAAGGGARQAAPGAGGAV